jgi:hypothetical protein
MPPAVVKTIEDLIYWQYAKIIAESAHIGKRDYGFVMNKFKQLRQGEFSGTRFENMLRKENRKANASSVVPKQVSHWSICCPEISMDLTQKRTWCGYAETPTPLKEPRGFMSTSP